MFYTEEERMELMKTAVAMKVPTDALTQILPIDMLYPICKIMEPHFYEFVKQSIDNFGLYHPLVVYSITTKEWQDELIYDKDQDPPDFDTAPALMHRIQCGVNRYYALKELGYDAVECLIAETVAQARDMCHTLRCDKRWQRPDNLVQLKALRGQRDV